MHNRSAVHYGQIVHMIECVTSRQIPFSSSNPSLDELLEGSSKPRLVFLNKMDLADPAATKVGKYSRRKEKKGRHYFSRAFLTRLQRAVRQLHLNGMTAVAGKANAPQNLKQ